jgi:hypothetical protein
VCLCGNVGENPDFKKYLVEDISGLLKKYLRDLPEPLITDLTPEDQLQRAFHDALSTLLSFEIDIHSFIQSFVHSVLKFVCSEICFI